MLGLEPDDETYPPWAAHYMGALLDIASAVPESREYIDKNLMLAEATRKGSGAKLRHAHSKLAGYVQTNMEDEERQSGLEHSEGDGLDDRAWHDAIVGAGERGEGGSIAGAWVNARPFMRGQGMSNAAFAHAVRARLCLPALGIACDAEATVKCKCGKPADRYGSHAHDCQLNGGMRTVRHNIINHAVAGLQARTEPMVATFYLAAATSVAEAAAAKAKAAAARARTRPGARTRSWTRTRGGGAGESTDEDAEADENEDADGEDE